MRYKWYLNLYVSLLTRKLDTHTPLLFIEKFTRYPPPLGYEFTQCHPSRFSPPPFLIVIAQSLIRYNTHAVEERVLRNKTETSPINALHRVDLWRRKSALQIHNLKHESWIFNLQSRFLFIFWSFCSWLVQRERGEMKWT